MFRTENLRNENLSCENLRTEMFSAEMFSAKSIKAIIRAGAAFRDFFGALKIMIKRRPPLIHRALYQAKKRYIVITVYYVYSAYIVHIVNRALHGCVHAVELHKRYDHRIALHAIMARYNFLAFYGISVGGLF